MPRVLLILPALLGLAVALAMPAAARPRGDDPTVQNALAQAGQLLIVGFAGTRPGDPGVETAARALRAGHIGGVIFFDENIVSRRQVQALTAYFRAAASDAKPLIAIDEEGGGVQRLTAAKGFSNEPSAMRMAKSRTPSEAQAIYRTMAEDLALLGFNLNLAPVVDLDVNRNNTVVSRARRSYAADPAVVEAYARAFIAAHRAAGVLTAIKHWPGHGSSTGDTHVKLVDVTMTHLSHEQRPFERLVASGDTDMIMVGHLAHARFDGSGRTPASLSPAALAALRRETRFTGPVISDDLSMSAVTRTHHVREAAVVAIAAGIDLALIGPPGVVAGNDPGRDSFRALVDAVLNGKIGEERINESNHRLHWLKQKLR